MKNNTRYFGLSIFAMLLTFATISAAPVIRSAQGANAAAIQGTVNLFKFDLGNNNGVGSSYRNGRREINWDDVPNNLASPNSLPGNYYNSTSPRGVVFSTTCSGGVFRVSASAASGTPARFGDIDPSYTTKFSTFSSERLFTARGICNTLSVSFYIPGTNIPATVGGFGAVFTNVEISPSASIICYDAAGNILPSGNMGVSGSVAGGLSFVGISYSDGERIARVDIVSGQVPLAAGNTSNVVAMDDFIYGEPRAREFHSGDSDGDGSADTTVFRPGTGDWYTLQSGSNTVRIDRFGGNGDVPINGDFDGDKLADVAIFRPSSGEWWFKRSSSGSAGTTFAAAFGAPGDKPVPGDYDKDGKTDIAFYRPSTNNWYVLRSSDNFASYYGYQFGAPGDIPVGASNNP